MARIIIESPAVEEIARTIDEIGLQIATNFTLADAIREGADHTDQATGLWIKGGDACALGAGAISARARGFL